MLNSNVLSYGTTLEESMYNQEEQLVATLETLGVRYISRLTTVKASQLGSPAIFLAKLIQQPGSRVRNATIAVLLAQPDLSQAIPAALEILNPDEQMILKFLYTAAVVLQKKYAERLRPYLSDRWLWLPDLFSIELGLLVNQPPEEQLRALGSAHRQYTGVVLNWSGTYENVIHHLLRRWELEKIWSP